MELALLASIYFAPWLIAWARGHHNTLAIFALTLLLGWTGLGWVVALIWSLTANVAHKPKAKIW